MFYALAIGSMLGYALQQTLLVHHARKIDGLSLAFYRGASFAVTLLPLTIGATMSDLQVIADHWMLLSLSGVTGGIFLSLTYASYKLLGVGFAGTINIAASTILTAIFGWVIFSEVLPVTGIALIGVILLGIVFFGFHYRSPAHVDARFRAGIGLILAGSAFVVVSKFSFAVITRIGNPLLAGYFWELSIGIGCLLMLLIRHTLTGIPLQRISWRTFCTVAACSLPTIVGTGFFALALDLGPIAIIAAIGASGLIIVTLLSWFFYSEKLRGMEWIGVAIVLAGVIGLRFS